MVLFNILKAGAKTLMGEGSFVDNLNDKLEFKIEKLPVSESPDFDVFGIHGKGNPQVKNSSPVVFIFKIFDKVSRISFR